MRWLIQLLQTSDKVDAVALVLAVFVGHAVAGTAGALRYSFIQPVIGAIFGEPWFLNHITINGSAFRPILIISGILEAVVIL